MSRQLRGGGGGRGRESGRYPLHHSLGSKVPGSVSSHICNNFFLINIFTCGFLQFYNMLGIVNKTQFDFCFGPEALARARIGIL